jgi:hypothetical protein
VLDAENRLSTIVEAVRLDSHRLVEEFMILAMSPRPRSWRRDETLAFIGCMMRPIRKS